MGIGQTSRCGVDGLASHLATPQRRGGRRKGTVSGFGGWATTHEASAQLTVTAARQTNSKTGSSGNCVLDMEMAWGAPSVGEPPSSNRWSGTPSSNWGESDAEPEEEERARRNEPAAIGRTAIPGTVVPAAAPVHAGRACSLASGSGVGHGTRRIVFIPVLAPFIRLPEGPEHRLQVWFTALAVVTDRAARKPCTRGAAAL